MVFFWTHFFIFVDYSSPLQLLTTTYGYSIQSAQPRTVDGTVAAAHAVSISIHPQKYPYCLSANLELHVTRIN